MTHPPIDPNQPPTPPVTDPPIETPPITPQAPAINLDEVRNLYNVALQEASQRATRAEQELERVRTAQPATPAPTPEQDRQEFFDNPRKLIREEMSQIIAPLNQFQQRFTKQETYNNFLQKNSVMPGFSYLKHPLVLQYLANAASQMPSLTDEALGGAYNMIVGHLFSTGQLLSQAPVPPAPTNEPSVNPTNPPNPQNPVQPPPSPRPATPIPPVPVNTSKRRQLNEHEKQLARFNNMTEDAFLDFLEMDKSEVARSSEVKK